MGQKYDFNQPLNKLDTETQTEGCRAFNPLFCSDYGSEGCALTNEKGICTRPRKSWKKKYNELKEKEKTENGV